jgi:Phosphotransferase enzyme family
MDWRLVRWLLGMLFHGVFSWVWLRLPLLGPIRRAIFPLSTPHSGWTRNDVAEMLRIGVVPHHVDRQVPHSTSGRAAESAEKGQGEGGAPEIDLGGVSVSQISDSEIGAAGEMWRISCSGAHPNMVVKLPRIRSLKDCMLFAAAPILERELRFYSELVPVLGPGIARHTPRLFAGAVLGKFSQSMLAMEDLKAQGFTGGCNKFLSKPQLIEVTKLLARLYVATWKATVDAERAERERNSPSTPCRWLLELAAEAVPPILTQFPAHWKNIVNGTLRGNAGRFAKRWGGDDEIRALGNLLAEPRVHAWFMDQMYNARWRGLAHNDCRGSNLFFRDGVPVLVDWQTYHRAQPLTDLALMVTTDVEDPRVDGELIAAFASEYRALEAPAEDLDVDHLFNVGILGAIRFHLMFLNIGTIDDSQTELRQVCERFFNNASALTRRRSMVEWLRKCTEGGKER